MAGAYHTGDEKMTQHLYTGSPDAIAAIRNACTVLRDAAETHPTMRVQLHREADKLYNITTEMERRCPLCHGTGEIGDSDSDEMGGTVSWADPCPECS